MIVVLEKETLSLRDGDDFGRFSLLCIGTRPAAGKAPGDIEITPDKHAWIPVSTVERLRGAPASDTWHLRFREMVEKARKFGWVDNEGLRIKAHVEYAAS